MITVAIFESIIYDALNLRWIKNTNAILGL
jgi:hypothetical protein